MQVHILGEEPPTGKEWCATCVMLYLAGLAKDKKLMEQMRNLSKDYANAELDWTVFKIPHRPDLPLYTAVTTAPSILMGANLPVCWTHIAVPEERTDQAPSGLIKGKSYGTPKGAG